MAPLTPPAGTRPDLSRLLLALDYDGTVTDHEYNVLAFQRLTGDAWRVFEDAVERGEMSHAECLERQVGLVTVSKRELLAANTDEVALAPGFAGFLEALVAGGGDRCADPGP